MPMAPDPLGTDRTKYRHRAVTSFFHCHVMHALEMPSIYGKLEMDLSQLPELGCARQMHRQRARCIAM